MANVLSSVRMVGLSVDRILNTSATVPEGNAKTLSICVLWVLSNKIKALPSDSFDKTDCSGAGVIESVMTGAVVHERLSALPATRMRPLGNL